MRKLRMYERLVGNDWESIQLAGFPDESRENHIPDDGGSVLKALLQETNTSVFSAQQCVHFINSLVTVPHIITCDFIYQ